MALLLFQSVCDCNCEANPFREIEFQFIIVQISGTLCVLVLLRKQQETDNHRVPVVCIVTELKALLSILFFW